MTKPIRNTVQVSPFDVTLDWVREIAGVPMETYIDWMRSCSDVTVMGCPAISVPAGFTPEGLPVGLQLVGKPGDDLGLDQFVDRQDDQAHEPPTSDAQGEPQFPDAAAAAQAPPEPAPLGQRIDTLWRASARSVVRSPILAVAAFAALLDVPFQWVGPRLRQLIGYLAIATVIMAGVAWTLVGLGYGGS